MMNNTINIRNNFPKVAARLDRLAVDVGNRAMVRALNTTVTQGKTQMARKISQEYRMSVGKARDRLEVDRASTKGGALRFEATLKATRAGKGRSMNLIAFVTGSKVSKASAKRQANTALAGQLQFQIKRGGGKKVITGAFIGNDGRTVFIRTGKGRLPIKALNTIDIPQMFNTRRINSVVREVMIKNFSANFNRELNVILKGFIR
ncbi:MAG: phage tail protein [Gallionellaceae bacterium]|jgi:hypothetical protein